MSHRPFPTSLAPSTTLVLLLLAALPATADKPADITPIVDEVRVEVVNVDVVVTDKKGLPISGLKPEDFVLYRDGKQVEITNFFSFSNGRIQPGTASGAAEEAWPDQKLRRRMAILFDNNTLEKRDREAAIDGLERFIMEQFDGTYEWAVIAYSGRVQLMQPFTADKTTVIGALARIRNLPVPVRQRHATDEMFAERMVLVSDVQDVARRRSLDQPGMRQLSAPEFELRERIMFGLKRFDRTARAAIETMRAYAGLPGRKSLVLVTGAMETLPGGSQLVGHGFPGIGSDGKTDPMIATLHDDLLKRFQAIVQTANAAGFAIYPIGASNFLRSKTPYLDVTRSAQLSLSSNNSASGSIESETAQNVMAQGTGGEYFATTKFYDAVDEIDNRTANSYVLGFSTDHAPDSEYHRIRVELAHPGLEVRHREGFLHISRRDRLVEELATPLIFPKDRGDFEVAVQILPPEKIGRKKVTLTVAGVIPIEDLTLIPQEDEMVGRIFMFLAVYDRDGKLVNLLRHHHDVRVPAAEMADAAPDAPARFGLKVKDLERGEYTVTLTLLDEISNRYGTGLQPVQL